MKGVDLSNYALEDLLAFDDIFLDYFNNFLRNQAFPQQVQYNRYLGLFEEINQNESSIIQLDSLPKRINLFKPTQIVNNLRFNKKLSMTPTVENTNETEMSKVFNWVRQERLPLFFRTDFFREFKLCKLLSRPLDEKRSDSATSSQLIGGYSRQTPVSATLSTEDQDGQTSVVAGLLYASNSNESLTTIRNELALDFEANINNIDLPVLERFNKALFQRPGSRALSVPSYFPFASINFSASSNIFTKSNIDANNNNNQSKPQQQQQQQQSYRLKSTKNNSNHQNDLINPLELKRHENLEDLTKISSDGSSAHSSNNRQMKLLVGVDESSATAGTTRRTIGFSLSDSAKNRKNSDTTAFNEITLNSFDESELTLITNNQNQSRNVELDETIKSITITNEDHTTINNANNNSKANNNNIIRLEEHLSFIEDDDDVENEQIIDDLIEYEGLHASINQYKERFLGSVRGMSELKEFLKDTNGHRLIKFWLDCEFYRDSMQDYDQIENMATRNRLFRDINEKYVFAFAKRMHEKVSDNYIRNNSLNHNLFDEIQYDALRRLRSYWIPRFILNKLKQIGKDFGTYPLPPLTPEFSRQSTYITAPSGPMVMHSSSKPVRNNSLTDEQKATLYFKVKEALHADKQAGGPFLRYISRNSSDNLALILFWYDVCDFNEVDTIGFDKNSRLQHAWAIYHSYLSPTARFNIGLSSKIIDQAKSSLQIQTNLLKSSSNEIDSNLFQPIMELIVTHLQNSWIQFIQDDVLKYTQARLAVLQSKLEAEDSLRKNETKEFFDKIPEPDLIIENEKIFLKRPWIQKYLSELNNSNEPEDNQPKRELTDAEKLKRRERIRLMEIERKKALKAHAKREKMRRLGQIMEDNQEDTKSDDKSDKRSIRKGTSFQSDRPLLFDKMLTSNKSMMQLFRKHLVDNGQRDLLYKFNAFLEAKQYLDQSDVNKKTNSAINIFKNYLDENSKKNILPLSERLNLKLNIDLQAVDQRGAVPRPRTPFILAFTRELRPLLEEQFQKFCEQQATERGMSAPEEFAILTQTELLVLLGDTFNPKDFDFDEEKGEGKSIASKDDRSEFLKLFYEWSIGKQSDKFYGFYAHLTEHGKKDGMPFLDKDLLFCIDTIRLKEINGEEVLKQKAQMVIEVYLDSVVQPSVQIDVSPELHQRLYRSALRIVQGSQTQNDTSVFDEARAQFFKELLPYWAGFKFMFKKSGLMQPLTKQEKFLRERLEEFLNTKNPSPSDFKLPILNIRPNTSTPPLNQQTNSKNPLHSSSQHSTMNIVFSIATGIRLKDERSTINTANSHVNTLTNTTSDRKNSVQFA